MFGIIADKIQQGMEEQIEFQGQKNKNIIIKKRERLVQIQQKLKKYYITIEERNRTKWRTVLKNNSYAIDWNRIVERSQSKEEFINLIVEAYNLITQLLYQLGQINHINTTITFIDDSYNYFRLDNMELTAEYVFLDKKADSKGGGYSLRLDMAKLNAIKAQKNQQKTQAAIAAHFQAFIAPFVAYQKVAKTGWKINKGVMAETFERHLENILHGSIESFESNDFESVGTRWQMYKASSGSDPFFTGPDTQLAQVKNANASLVSDARTVINAIEGILKITDAEGNLTKKKNELDKIFKQAKTKQTIREDVLIDLQQQFPDVVKSILQQIVASGENSITVIYQKPGNKTRSRKKIKINTDTFTLNGSI